LIKKEHKGMSDPATNPARPWPELLKPATAAAMIDMAPSTFRALLPALRAHWGVHVVDVCGPKINRMSLLGAMEKLRQDGKEIRVRKAEGTVEIGDKIYKSGHKRQARKDDAQ